MRYLIRAGVLICVNHATWVEVSTEYLTRKTLYALSQ